MALSMFSFEWGVRKPRVPPAMGRMGGQDFWKIWET